MEFSDLLLKELVEYIPRKERDELKSTWEGLKAKMIVFNNKELIESHKMIVFQYGGRRVWEKMVEAKLLDEEQKKEFAHAYRYLDWFFTGFRKEKLLIYKPKLKFNPTS